jgi:hypothetical protein
MDESTNTDRIEQGAAVGTRRHTQRFFFRVPNIVFELDLSPYELSLYCVIRRTAGDDGICFRSGAGLGRLSGMSSGQVSRCKKRLATPFEKLGGKPLIRITARPSPHGGKRYHEISVVGIWNENDQYFSPYQSARTSHSELASFGHGVATSAGETKKTPGRKTEEERPPSLSPSLREMTGEGVSELPKFWNFLRTIFKRTDHRGPTKGETRLMRRLLPILPEEYKRINWWIELEQRGYDCRVGIGFDLLRRPRSVRSLLLNWSSVNDVARQYWNKFERNGHFF